MLSQSLNRKFDIIALFETWLCDHEHGLFSIEGYTSYFISRENRRGGGVCIYIKKKHNYKVLKAISKCSNLYNKNSTESIFLEIDCGKPKIVVVGCIYNPPGNSVEKCTEYISDITYW